jgi:hypothetical protein
VTTEGLSAPRDFVWARGKSGVYHFLRLSELPPQGAPLRYHSVRSLCGLFASLLRAEADTPEGWEEVTPRAAPEPRSMCTACLAAVAQVQRRDRLAIPPAAQPRLL